MALQFSSSIKYAYLFRGLLLGMASQSGGYPNTIGYTSMSIYGGTRATAAQLLASWSSYNSTTANFLAHYVSAAWNIPNVSSTTGNILTISSLPSPVIPVHTGTGTWAVIWPTNAAYASFGSGTIPSTSFVIVDVSDLGGVGVLKFNTLDFVTGISHSMYSGSLYSAFP